MNTERLTNRNAYLRAMDRIHAADERGDYKKVSEAAQELRYRAETLSRTLTHSERSEPQVAVPDSPSTDGSQPAGMGVSTCNEWKKRTAGEPNPPIRTAMTPRHDYGDD